MVEDARFEDAGGRPLRLRALDADDLSVVSALAQDSVFTGADLRWTKSDRRLALLINRFRWEEQGATPPERVRAVLVIEDVQSVKSQGVSKGDPDTILSLLSIAFEAGEDGTGRVLMTLAGDGAIACDVEALEVVLKDVTKPYVAPSRKTPSHPL